MQKYTPPEDGHDEWLDTPFDDTDAIVLQRFFNKHVDKVGKELLSTTQVDDGDEDEPCRLRQEFGTSYILLS